MGSRSRFTARQIEAIRADNDRTIEEIAADYGITRVYVRMIKNGEAGHTPRPDRTAPAPAAKPLPDRYYRVSW